jgi:hypothetical protein
VVSANQFTRIVSDNLEQSSEAERVFKRNRESRRQRITLLCDAERGEWKITTEDLRDIDQIMAEERLSPPHRLALDTSSIVLAEDGFIARFQPSVSYLFLMPRNKAESDEKCSRSHTILSCPLHFGIIGENLEESTTSSMTESFLSGRSVLAVTLESEQRRHILEVDPQVDYQFRRYRIYSHDAQLRQESVADDYRLVDGVYYPFKFEKHEFDQQGNVTRHEKIIVQNVRFNHRLSPDVFQINIPAETKILVVGRPGGQSRLAMGQVLGLGGLRNLVDQIRSINSDREQLGPEHSVTQP